MTYHKRADIREAIAAAGRTLEFLPLLARPQPHRAFVSLSTKILWNPQGAKRCVQE
jgi:hypothetical protein